MGSLFGLLCQLPPPALLQAGRDRLKKKVICGSGLLFRMWWDMCIYLFWVHLGFETLMSKLPGLHKFPFKIAVMVWIHLPAVQDNAANCSPMPFFLGRTDGCTSQLCWLGENPGRPVIHPPCGPGISAAYESQPKASSGHPGHGSSWGMLGPHNVSPQ